MEKRKWAIEPEKVKEFVDKVLEAARKNKERQTERETQGNGD